MGICVGLTRDLEASLLGMSPCSRITFFNGVSYINGVLAFHDETSMRTNQTRGINYGLACRVLGMECLNPDQIEQLRRMKETLIGLYQSQPYEKVQVTPVQDFFSRLLEEAATYSVGES